MSRQTLLFIVLTLFVTLPLGVLAREAQQKSAEEQAITKLIKRHWEPKTSQELEQTLSWPHAQLDLDTLRPALYRNPAEYNKQQRAQEKSLAALTARRSPKQGEIGHVTSVAVTPRLSHIKVRKMEPDVAYVTYELRMVPAGRARSPWTTIPLVAVVKREQAVWRIVFLATL